MALYQGKYDKAEALLREALAINENSYGPESRAAALSLNNLATLLGDSVCWVDC